jgi:hypothetical protein
VLAEILAEQLGPRRLRTNPRVIKRKMSNWGVKRPDHRNPPQPTRAPSDAITVLAALGNGIVARRCPAWRWRELGLGFDAERVNLSSRARGRPVALLWPAVVRGRESLKRRSARG